MCIIAYNQRSAKKIPAKTFLTCARKNSDGIGLMWAQNGELQIYKTLHVKEAWRKYIYVRKELREDVAIHFRAATHGKVTESNCHPFKVTDNLAMMHNGIIPLPNIDKGEVDSKAFVERVIKHLPENWLENSDLRELVGGYIGSSSKLLFMSASNRVYIINKNRGTEHEGTWFSNYGFRSYLHDPLKTKKHSYYDNREPFFKESNYYNRSYNGSKHKTTEHQRYKDWWKDKETYKQARRRREKYKKSREHYEKRIKAKKEEKRENASQHLGWVWSGYVLCDACIPEDLIENSRRLTRDDLTLPDSCQTCRHTVTFVVDDEKIRNSKTTRYN